MDKLIVKIDSLIEDYTERLTQDTVRLVNINSEQSEPLPGAPFGLGPRRVLDTVLEMAQKEGLFVKDYGTGVVSVAMKNTQPDLGIWAHGDVVPAGAGWTYPPYNATVYKDCIIGRGATDNKGQLAAIFNLFKIFKEMNIELDYNPALYVGSNEETGMKDLLGIEGNPDAKGFLNVADLPKMSLVPDSGFPTGYGARGLTTFKIKAKTPVHNFVLTAGQEENPGLATAVFDNLEVLDKVEDCTVTKDKNTTKVEAYSPPRHTAYPDPNGNMITKLAKGLLDAGVICKEDRYILEFFKDISLDTNGKMLDIYAESKLMQPTTVFAKSISCCDGFPELEIKVRYPIEITYDELRQRLSDVCEAKGFSLSGEVGHPPYVNDGNKEMLKVLTEISNSVTGEGKEPYISGTTYAHYLPNAYVYGMNGCKVPEGFPEGHGGAHSVDECVSLERLKRAMRIYARVLLELNDMKW